MPKFMSRFLCFYFILVSIASAKIYRSADDLDWKYNNDVRRARTVTNLQNLSLREYQSFIDMDVNSRELNPYYNIDSRKPVYLSMRQAEMALRAANSNPVVSLYAYDKYDPNNEGIGFCFGRAMFIDLYLAMNGLNRGSIKKAFVVGPMTAGGANWGWHVTTIAQSQDRNGNKIWLAIDPIMGRVMEAQQWYKETLKISDDGYLRLYITDSGKFAQSPSAYNERAITQRGYNSYFIDMMKWFEQNDITRDLRLR